MGCTCLALKLWWDTWCVKCPLVWPSFSCSQLLASLDCVPVQDFQEQSIVNVWLQLLCTSGRWHPWRRHCVHKMRLREMMQDWIVLWCITTCVHVYALYIPNAYSAQKCYRRFYWEFTTVKVPQLLFICKKQCNNILYEQCAGPNCDHEEYPLGTACGNLLMNFRSTLAPYQALYSLVPSPFHPSICHLQY